jgi:hypothetical protein
MGIKAARWGIAAFLPSYIVLTPLNHEKRRLLISLLKFKKAQAHPPKLIAPRLNKHRLAPRHIAKWFVLNPRTTTPVAT